MMVVHWHKKQEGWGGYSAPMLMERDHISRSEWATWER